MTDLARESIVQRADAEAALSAAIEYAEQTHDELVRRPGFQPWTFRERLGYLLGSTAHAYTLWNTIDALRSMDAADRLAAEVKALGETLDSGEVADDAKVQEALVAYDEARQSMIEGAIKSLATEREEGAA